ncbi:MAG: hypothetical protein FJ316_05065 [SAR202 cluster bacterium]|nr:hypothetical protein [SAR202 cluster bacterium]
MTSAKAFTAKELLQLPGDGWRYELVKGKLKKCSLAFADHGILAMKLCCSLYEYVGGHRLGEVFMTGTGLPAADVTILTASDTLDGQDVAPAWKLPLAEWFASNIAETNES